MIATVVTVSGQLAQLCRKGILLVRMTWMMSVCVKQRLYEPTGLEKRLACWIMLVVQSQQPKKYNIMKYVV